MARNYWDEMGNGGRAGVHTDLHRQMADALQLPEINRRSLPEAALACAALGGLLMVATGDDRSARAHRVASRTALPARPEGVPPARRSARSRTFLRRARRCRSVAWKGLAEHVVAPLADEIPA